MTAYTSVTKNNKDTVFTRVDYKSGYALYCFDLDELDQHVLRKGNTRLSLRMREALKETVTVIVYGQFPGIMSIDQARNIHVV